MNNETAIKKLLEYYGIPPHHNSANRGNTVLISSIESCFNLPLAEIEKVLKFEQVRNAYENHMRRVGKELNNIVKQISR